jgi:hypothetical protein
MVRDEGWANHARTGSSVTWSRHREHAPARECALRRNICALPGPTGRRRFRATDIDPNFDQGPGCSTTGWTGARNGSQCRQTVPDPPRPVQTVFPGYWLSVRLRPTAPDSSELPCTQRVGGPPDETEDIAVRSGLRTPRPTIRFGLTPLLRSGHRRGHPASPVLGQSESGGRSPRHWLPRSSWLPDHAERLLLLRVSRVEDRVPGLAGRCRALLHDRVAGYQGKNGPAGGPGPWFRSGGRSATAGLPGPPDFL